MKYAGWFVPPLIVSITSIGGGLIALEFRQIPYEVTFLICGTVGIFIFSRALFGNVNSKSAVLRLTICVFVLAVVYAVTSGIF